MQMLWELLLKSKHFLTGPNRIGGWQHLYVHCITHHGKVWILNLEKNIKKTVLLSGASGMLGKAIAKALEQQKYSTLQLVRRVPQYGSEIPWNPAKGELDPAPLESLAAAIHLSGANVATTRWTESYKQEMLDSRVTTTRVLSEALARLKNPPPVLIVASAVGFYGNRGDEVLDEESSPGTGFFPHVCQQWEEASLPAEQAGIRVVHLRFGPVLGPDGGIVAHLTPMFRLCLGGRLGNGRQWLSWISETDAVRTALFALDSESLTGPLNCVAPEPVTNATFTREFAHALNRLAFLPAPAFALRLAFGTMADDALLASTRAVPKRLLQAGFQFTHPTLKTALTAALIK